MNGTAGEISVVIPVYNRQHLLMDTLRSVERQRLRPAEVIVIDDGSTEDVIGAVKTYARRSRLTIHCIPNSRRKGVSGATNCGLDMSRSKFIALMDSDDLWLPRHLEQLAAALAQFPEAAMAFSAVEFFGDAADTSSQTALFERSVQRCLAYAFDRERNGSWIANRRLLEALLLWGVPFRCPASLMRRSLVREQRLYFDEDISYTQDAQFMTLAAWHGPFVYLPSVGLRIRRYAGGDGDARYGDRVFKSYDTRVLRLKEYFRNRRLGRHERKALNRRLADLQSWAMALRSRDRSLFWKAGECVKLMKRVPGIYSFRTIARTAYRQWLRGSSSD